MGENGNENALELHVPFTSHYMDSKLLSVLD